MNDAKSLSHSKWRCKYHIVFAPKYRRQAIYRQLKQDVGKILRDLCERKKVEIIEAECCPDHIHMLVAIPPYMSVAGFMGYLKSKSSLMIFDRRANLKTSMGTVIFGAVDITWTRWGNTKPRSRNISATSCRKTLRMTS